MVLHGRMIMAMVVFAFAMRLNLVSAKVGLADSDRTKTLDCAGSSARIAGSNNKVTLTGGCTAFTILDHGTRSRLRWHTVPAFDLWVRKMRSFGQRLTVKSPGLAILASATP